MSLSGRPASLILPLLALIGAAACSNIPEKHFATVSGTRHTTGTSPDEDTAADDTGGGGDTGTASDDGSPVITDAAAEISANDNGEFYLLTTVWFTDGQGDVEGGAIYFNLIDLATGSSTDETYDIVSVEDFTDPTAQAQLEGDIIRFYSPAPVEEDGAYTVDAIVIKDTAGHRSNEASQSVNEQ